MTIAARSTVHDPTHSTPLSHFLTTSTTPYPSMHTACHTLNTASGCSNKCQHCCAKLLVKPVCSSAGYHGCHQPVQNPLGQRSTTLPKQQAALNTQKSPNSWVCAPREEPLLQQQA
jgi:hypothetical protein